MAAGSMTWAGEDGPQLDNAIRRAAIHDQTLCLYTVQMCSMLSERSWHVHPLPPGRGGLSWYPRMVPPAALERLCRLHAVVLCSRTVRGEQADHVTGGTCVPDDDGREA